jgi:hypothetical protein
MVPLKREVSHTHVLIPDPVYDEYARASIIHVWKT